MTYNLLENSWIPIKRANGQHDLIAPWQVTDQLQDDGHRIVALDTPRPDFNSALLQFLIGLLQTAAPPEQPDDSDWIEWLESPPSPETLKEKFTRYTTAFDLDGDGPRFMQDYNDLGATKFEPIAGLFLESPGENTLKNNADHFIKRDQIKCLCPACATIGLYTLQTNAPSGGAGHRTSLRGGGPLTTLVVLDPKAVIPGQSQVKDTLWVNLWLNVLNSADLACQPQYNTNESIFPWLAPTRTSEAKTGKDTYPTDTNPLQMYWGMPRRIRLDLENTSQGTCDICGAESNQLIYQYTTKNYGINYNGPWQHPLSPHRFDSDSSPIPLHPQPGGFSYRHWLNLVSDGEQTKAAHVVNVFKTRKLKEEQLRLLAFGYDMDNMKARCWYEATFPLYLLSDEIRELFTDRVKSLVDAATNTSGFLRTCIKDAWFKRPGDAKGDTTFLNDSFYVHTEQDFYHALDKLREQLTAGDDGKKLLHEWHTTLRTAAIYLFDYWTSQGGIEFSNPRRIADARKKLFNFLYSKKMKEILKIPNKKEMAA